MNETELRAYAVRGLTSRLVELDGERQRIQELLAEWAETPVSPAGGSRRTMSEDARRRIGDAARQRWSRHRAAVANPELPAAETGPEAARVLPRRGKSHQRTDTAPSAPALPPMPRLIKKAS